jgi:hypothetical protein
MCSQFCDSVFTQRCKFRCDTFAQNTKSGTCFDSPFACPRNPICESIVGWKSPCFLQGRNRFNVNKLLICPIHIIHSHSAQHHHGSHLQIAHHHESQLASMLATLFGVVGAASVLFVLVNCCTRRQHSSGWPPRAPSHCAHTPCST